MKKFLLILILLWGAGAAGWWYLRDPETRHESFKTIRVKKGDLFASINATGTIEPEEVVDVGAQVAGLVQSFGADPRDKAKPISYGSPVDEGTILARLDDALFKARVAQAEASLRRSVADVEQADAKLRQTDRDLKRQEKLRAKGNGVSVIQDYDTALANYESAKAALDVARSQVAVSQANLDEARVNLGYTTVRSPVKGVILDRRVNIGQTVIASLNAPSLFLIAKDLSRMEIWASVNETDVGAIHNGQAVRFSVGTFPDETFRGKVSQIRLNASMVQSVVTYTVVVEVDNHGGKLLPYLTARLQFEVDARRGVLLVPNAALRWRPPAEDVAPSARAAYEAERKQEAAARRTQAKPGGTPATLWVREGQFVRPIAVRAGLSDGVQVEVAGEGLREGTDVVVGVVRQKSDGDISSILPYTNSESSSR